MYNWSFSRPVQRKRREAIRPLAFYLYVSVSISRLSSRRYKSALEDRIGDLIIGLASRRTSGAPRFG